MSSPPISSTSTTPPPGRATASPFGSASPPPPLGSPAPGPPPPSERPSPGAAASAHPPRLVPLAAGLAVVLSSSALTGVLRGDRWLWYLLASVGLVVALGVAARAVRAPAWVAPVLQVTGLTLLLTGLFSTEGVLRVLPGPAALAELAEALGAAVGQIEGGVPPVPTSMAMALLVSLGFGLVAIVVDGFAAAGHAPAACGLVLLGAYTVPTALAPRALPDWSLAAGAFGYTAVLLTAHGRRQARRGIPAAPPVRPRRAVPVPVRRGLDRMRRSVPSGGGTALAVLLTATALAAALGAGVLAKPIGTQGRFAGNGHGDSGASDGQFGLNPFTSLRGQLDNDTPVELLRVRGLPVPQYLRATTLSRYVPQQGWQLSDRPDGVTLDQSLPSGLATPANNPTAVITIQNVGYLDQWLPLYGLPMGVTGVVSGRWHYDVLTNTAYTDLPVREPTWTERAGLPDPSVPALQQSPPTTDVSPTFLDTSGVDPRITALAQAVTREAPTPFLRAVALNRYFLDPAFGFRYSLRTRPGNTGDDLVDFLTRGKTGYCEQFASAMAVMLRTVGVPARVAIGFSAGKPVGDFRQISTGDAHAWVEAYFAGVGWLPFDPTPLNDGRGVQPDYVTNAPKVGIEIPPAVAAGQPGPDQAGGQPHAGQQDRQPGADDQRQGNDSDAGPRPESGGSAPPPPSQPPAPAPGPGPSPGETGGNGDTGARDGAGAGDGSGNGQAGSQGGTGTSGSSGSEAPSGAGDTGSGAGAGGAGAGAGEAGAGGAGDDSGEWRVGGVLVGLRTVLLAALALLALIGLALMPAVLRYGARQQRLAQAARGGPGGAVAAWREVLAEFRDRGSEPPRNATVRSTARRLARSYRLDSDAINGMKCVVKAVEQGWYAARPDPGPGADLVAAVDAVRAGLARTGPLPLTARLWPRSLLPPRPWRRRSEARSWDDPARTGASTGQDRVLVKH